MAEFGLIRSFGIDDGQLDGLRPQEIFVLGYELALVDAAIELNEPTTMLIHANNRERIASECQRKKLRYQLTWARDDASENWMELHITPEDS